MVRDFDRSSGDRVVQQIDKVTGLPLWVVEVIDADEAARQRTVKVKVAATVQPVLPSPAPGSPFTAVELVNAGCWLQALMALLGHYVGDLCQVDHVVVRYRRAAAAGERLSSWPISAQVWPWSRAE